MSALIGRWRSLLNPKTTKEGVDTNEIADETFEEVLKRLKQAMIDHPGFAATLVNLLEPLRSIETLGGALYSLNILEEALNDVIEK